MRFLKTPMDDTPRNAASDPDRATRGQAICPYCGVGCRLWMEAADGALLRVQGVADAPANLGGICAKGATLPQVVQTHDRLTQPQFRSARGRELRTATWDATLEWTARRFRAIIDAHGPDSVAFYGSGQLDSEAVYVAGKLFKGSIGTNNTDSNSRLCMAAAVAGYKANLGADGPPPCYADIDVCDCVVAWGSNMAEAHPVTFDRVKARRKADPAVELIVVDPRRTATAELATLHVPVAPGGDVPLMNAVGRLLLEAGAIDRPFIDAHVNDFDAYRDFLLAGDLARWIEESGVDETVVRDLAGRVGRSKAWLTFYCMGLNQSTVGMWKNNSLINLHLLTGRIGKPGSGPFSLTGQPNAMGGREGGLLAQALPGYREVANPEHRAEVERHWGRPAGTISDRPGLTAVEMFRALETGRLKAVWIAATNPAVSLPDLHQARRALAAAELVVVPGRLSPDRDHADGRRAAAGGPVVGEDRHQHQQRAPGLAQRPGDRPPRLGLARLANPREVRPGDGLRRLRLQDRGGGLGRVRPADRRPPLRHGRHDGRPPA